MSDPVVKWWFSHEEYWFNSTPETDAEVIKALDKYLELGQYQKLTHLGKILVDDQVIRHYYREPTLEGRRMILDHGKFAIRMTKNHLDNLDKLELTPAQECFFLMPLRHSPDEEDRKLAITEIKKLMVKRKSPYYERFLKAALIRIRNPEEVLEQGKVDPELICKSFKEKPLIPRIDLEFINPELSKAFEKVPRDDESQYDLVISISGGSDSMLLLWTAVQLGYRVIALGIDYGNREEHSREVEFVKWFTQQLDVPYYVRSIEEIKRIHSSERAVSDDPLSSMREFYEDVTRKIRFSAYSFFGLPVLLGHNWDDCFENWVTNTFTGTHSDNLLGMSFYGVDSGVEMYRPFLNVKKKNIVSHCNYYGIPYLVDSTPKWSRRGRIRDNIRPVLDEFDPKLAEQIIKGAIEKSEMVNDYQELVENYGLLVEDSKYTFKIPGIRSVLFWKLMIARIASLSGSRTVKIGSIRNLIKMIDEERGHTRMITLSPQLRGILEPRTKKVIVERT